MMAEHKSFGGEKTLGTWNYIAYGSGDMYGGGSFFIVSTFAMYFLVNVVGLNPFLAGLIPGLGKIWDALSDPLMGYISDHTKSRFGRRRIFFLIGVIPIIATFSLIWLSVSFDSQLAIFLYYFFTYILFYTTTTMVMVPYFALSAEITKDFKKRNRLTGFRMGFSMFGTLLAGVAVQPIIDAFSTAQTGHLVMGIIFSVIFAVPWIFVFLGTWEYPVSIPKTVGGKLDIFKNFKTIFENRAFRIHIAMYICSYAAMDIMMAWLKFYLQDYLNKPGFITLGLGTILITQIAALPVYVRLANTRGHAFAYRTGLIIWAAAIFFMYFHGNDTSFLILTINCFFIGAGLSAGVVIPFQLLPFIVDVDELMTGENRAGTYSGAMTLLRKLIQGALVLPLLGLLLNIIGYVSHTTDTTVIQSSSTIQSLRILFVLLPIIFMITGIFVSKKFILTPQNHKKLKTLTKDFDDGKRAEECSQEEISLCKNLTGEIPEKLKRFS
ncbi:MAG: MFS transporter [Spirochaetia bacterium]|nr:MFS transporter [Spirochaetia bacterium]